MNESTDKGTIAVLLQLFEEQHYPRALRIKERLESGGSLVFGETMFLNEAMETVRQALPIVQRNTEYKELGLKIASFYLEIADLAAKNESSR